MLMYYKCCQRYMPGLPVFKEFIYGSKHYGEREGGIHTKIP